MVWIYLADMGESQSPSKTMCTQSPIARSSATVKQYSSIEWGTELYIEPQSGMTYEHLIPLNFQSTPSTSFMEAFHAKILVLQEMEKAWKESEAAYFSRSFAWPKKSSPLSYSLRTCQLLQAEGDYASLEKLPRSGMIVDMTFFPLKKLEHHIKERDGSCLLGTPCARESTTGRSKKFLTPGKAPTAQELLLTMPTPNTLDYMAPRSLEAQKRVFESHRKGRTAPSNLREWILPTHWPQNLLPTPRARERTGPAEDKRDSPQIAHLVFKATGKKLNPPFVEWMMGLPIGHTELGRVGMEWYLSKSKKHLKR